MSRDSIQSTSGGPMCGKSDLKSALEAAFGPGAFELIAEPELPGQVDHEASGYVSSPGSGGCRSDGSLAIAVENSDSRERTDPKSAYPFVLFGLAEDFFALPVSCIVEVRRSPAVTRIPRVPDWIEGVVNFRGSIISVVDLRRRLGTPSEACYTGRRMIVARSAILQSTVGILVDRIVGMVSLTGADAGAPSRPLDETTACYVSRLMTYDSQPVAVLNLEKTIEL